MIEISAKQMGGFRKFQKQYLMVGSAGCGLDNDRAIAKHVMFILRDDDGLAGLERL